MVAAIGSGTDSRPRVPGEGSMRDRSLSVKDSVKGSVKDSRRKSAFESTRVKDVKDVKDFRGVVRRRAR